MKMQDANQTIVLGLGISGRSTIRFLLREGGSIIGVDDRLQVDPELQSFQSKGVQFFSMVSKDVLSRVKCLVKSPGIPESHPLVKEARCSGIPVIGDMELIAHRLAETPCIGVTGTNGKTTVSLLIGHLLQATGKAFKVCGNVGVPITDVAMENDYEGLVIELSSYQLDTLSTPFLDAAVLLNITPDHLDRYASFDEYKNAKLKIFSLLKNNGWGIAHESVRNELMTGINTYGNHSILPAEVLQNYRSHDLDNIEAALQVCRRYGLSDNEFTHALFTFKKPPHRIELISRVRGVSYYNDSKGTNVDAVEKAVQAMEGNVLLIAGGVDKGSSFISWKQCFIDKVKIICAIGEAASKLQRELGDDFPVEIFEGLHQAVARASALSKPGDNILLSPGCASFDMFRNYEHRGDEFKRIVQLVTMGEKET